MKLQVSWMDKIASQGGAQDLINMQTHAFAATVPDTVPPQHMYHAPSGATSTRQNARTASRHLWRYANKLEF